MPQFRTICLIDVCDSCGAVGFKSSDNVLGGSDVSRDVLYEPRGKVDLIRVVFSKYWSCIPSAIKIVLEAMNV